MKELIKSVEQAIVESKTYMDVESKTNKLDLFLSTRENGDVGNETPSLEDLNEAQRVQKIIQSKFPELKITISTTDEWTNLHIQKPKPIEYRYEYRTYEQGRTDWKASCGGNAFKNFDDLIASLEDPYFSSMNGNGSGYGLKGVDWKSVKKELDNITEFPKDLFVGRHRSKLIPLAMVGKFGNEKTRDVYVSITRSDQ
jgi:chromosome condensin MukBEF ATPase and DNA-binding subunit MukB